MGLDMYLRAQVYVSGYEFAPPEQQALYKLLVKETGAEAAVDPDTPSANVSLTVAYWRKSNQIHSWFVAECQNGVDECQETYVTREKLRELRELCLRVLALPTEDEDTSYSRIEADGRLTEVTEKRPAIAVSARDEAEEILATKSGFFFGSVEYDAWYLADIKETVKQLDRVLAMDDKWEFYYQSSW